MLLFDGELLCREARQVGFEHRFDALMEVLEGMRAVVGLPPAGAREKPRIRIPGARRKNNIFMMIWVAPLGKTLTASHRGG